MRLAYYAGASTLAAGACLLKAFSQRPNFYSATVYLSQSNACLLILTNLLLLLSTTFLYLLQRLLYGPLRPIEIEQLSEKAWYAVLDTLLAMPSFREDVGGRLLVMFVLLLAGKVWGWIGEGRVDVLEQGQMTGNGAHQTLFHARLATSLLLSVAFAVSMFVYCVDIVIEDPRPGMMVIFTFEFAILCVFSAFTLVRYGLAAWELRVVKQQTTAAIEQRKEEIKAEREAAIVLARQEEREVPTFDEPIEVDENEIDVPGWEDKRRALFAVEVVTDFIKLMIYIFFFTVSVTFNGLPMHIMRDVYMTFASFSKRVSDYMAYRKATSDMNTRYPDATTEEIRGDSCIVCREEMFAWSDGVPQAPAAAPAAHGQPAPAPAAAPPASRRRDEGLRAKKLPCGHILHLRCLKAWLERQQVCPTCRRPVVLANAAAAPGGNGAAPGQPGQAQAPRPRGRIFNLGPLRIGMVNAPRGQIQNVLNQIRNGDAQAAQQAVNPAGNAVAGGAAQQPNVAAPARVPGVRASVPTDVYLMQLEQRIMQDAHNLGLQQQQLANLRMMEAELARLRAQRLPHQNVFNHRHPMPGFAPQHQPQPPQQLRGNLSQQMGSGHEHLPPGMVLPEGWTVMPLQPVGGQNQLGVRLPGSAHDWAVPVTTEGQQPAATDAVTGVADAVAPGTTVPQRPSGDARGPTDDNGSPLFVPTTTQLGPEQNTATQTDSQEASTLLQDGIVRAEQSISQLEQLQSSNSQQPDAAAIRDAEVRGEAAGQRWAEAFGNSDEANATPQAANATASQDVAEQSQTQAPWTNTGWTFDSSAQDSSQSAAALSSAGDGRVPEQGQTQIGGTNGKGKGRAVEVEEVADPDA